MLALGQGQDSSPEEGSGGQKDGRTEDVGAAVVAGCNGPPVLTCWFLAAATGRDARRDALLDQHLTDFVPVLPFIPHHRGRRRQVLAHPIGQSGGGTPLVEAGRRGTGFDVSGVNHQHLWLWGIG